MEDEINSLKTQNKRLEVQLRKIQELIQIKVIEYKDRIQLLQQGVTKILLQLQEGYENLFHQNLSKILIGLSNYDSYTDINLKCYSINKQDWSYDKWKYFMSKSVLKTNKENSKKLKKLIESEDFTLDKKVDKSTVISQYDELITILKDNQLSGKLTHRSNFNEETHNSYKGSDKQSPNKSFCFNSNSKFGFKDASAQKPEQQETNFRGDILKSSQSCVSESECTPEKSLLFEIPVDRS